MQILFEDNHIIAVVKPAGALSQGDLSNDRSIMDDIKDYIKKEYNKPGEVYLGLLHRLDRVVEGVMVFAKTSKAASRLSEAIRNRDFEKDYIACVEGSMHTGDSFELRHFLKKNEKDKKAMVYESEMPNAKEARLVLNVIENHQGNSKVAVKLLTGRFHQIRSQLAHVGHPIIGDWKYGAKRPRKDKSIMLYCVRLRFKHPTKDEIIEVSYEPQI